MCFLLTGCGVGKSDPLKEFSKMIENTDSYYLEGKMDIVNNEETYTYDVKVNYKKNDNYLVELNNTLNNHKQIILRNADGVYVITPSLNKSFKFQSDWPYNNSQSYLLGSIVEDLNNDENRVVEEKDGSYVMSSVVNYPNNKKLVKQIVTLDKKYKVKNAEVLDEKNNSQIKMNFSKIDLNAKIDDDLFKLSNYVNETVEKNTNEDNNNTNASNTDSNNNISSNNANTNSNNNINNNSNNNTNNNDTSNNDSNDNEEEKTKSTATIDDILYPMYLPSNTYLKNQQKLDKSDGQRLILTFDGDSPFILIEETIAKSDEHIIIPTFGELSTITDTIGVVGDNSINWFSGNMEYYVASDKMDKSELLEVARSISVLPVSK